MRAMSLTEVAHRVQDVVHTKAQLLGLGLAHPTEPKLDKFGAAWVDVMPREVDVARHQLAAERILMGQFDVFASCDCRLA